MHGEQAAHLRTARTREDIQELLRLVRRLRLRFGLERAVVFVLRGVMAGAVLLALISGLEWLGLVVPPGLAAAWPGLAGVPVALALVAGVPVAIALAIACVRWPSQEQAARRADERLGLAERLGTAVQVAGPGWRSGRFDALQVRDALASAQRAPAQWLALDGRVWRELACALVLVVFAAASRLLVDLPRPSFGGGGTDAAAAVSPGEAAPDASDQPQAPAVAQPTLVPQAQALAQDPSLAARAQQAQAEQDALDKLSSALGQVSAGQPAADAIQRGDYAGASKEMASLGEQADQLTDAAKQKLASSLDAAANATTTDQQLADRERQAAQALSRGAYAGQQQALQQLGQQIERSGSQTLPPDQLARGMGQLEQQAGAGAAGASGAAGQSPSSQAAGAGAGQSKSGAASQGSPGGATGAAGSAGSGGGSGGGQQGGPGSGTGPGGNPLGDPNPRLDTSGQRVEVPTKLSQGSAMRPPDSTTDQAETQSANGARSVSESLAPQQTGEVTPEQNLVPGQQRAVVRGYFR